MPLATAASGASCDSPQRLRKNKMPTYNGHKNWNHWNVSLWINNDEGLYRLALSYAGRFPRDQAARLMLAELPDRAPYSVSAIRAAMVGI
jgi:hypothetical protein